AVAAPAAAQEEPQQGGTLKVAVIGEPPAVADAVFTTATLTNNVSSQIFEGLFALDSQYTPQPMLVESYDLSPDGLSYRFTLRQGVKFHNGKDLSSADVLASLNRWGEINGRGRLVFGRLDTIEAPDARTITMTFNQPTGVLLSFLARSEALISPAESAEAAGAEAMPEDMLIGTGPFMFQEHQVDQYIRFGRYDGYAPREEAADGWAGKKVAYLDELEIIPVPDDSVRANGVLTGEYHFADTVPPDLYETLQSDSSVQPIIVEPYYWYAPHFNKRQGLFTNPLLRQAVQLAFNQSEAMLAGFGRQEFVRSDPSVSAPETVWHSTAGSEAYDQPDVERARALLEEGGYAGETVRWLATREYSYNFNMADFIKQGMEAIGMTVELVVSDWATLVENRAKPEAYEIFLTGHSSYVHPTTHPFNDKEWPGFWDSAAKDDIIGRMVAETDSEALKGIIDEYTTLIWSEMPFVKCGDNFLLRALRSEVTGYTNPPDWFFWNVGMA
ncbi:MAG: ABC transporter substrate-binding protein, partial [Thermomicrobiales bacterium]